MRGCRLLCRIGYDSHLAVQSRRHRLPCVIKSLFVVKVNHIDFLELAPFHSIAVHLGDAVGWQVGNIYLQGVFAFLDMRGEVATEGDSKECCNFFPIENYTGRLAHIA